MKKALTALALLGFSVTLVSCGPEPVIGPTGPQGEQGIPGEKGETGPQGEKGDEGKSAYEIYKETYGYEGSEKEWLDDLINGRLPHQEKIQHTVTFNSNGGSEVEDQKVIHLEKAKKPNNPIKDGYTFNNWTYQNEVWSFVGYVVTEDMTLLANYEANEYDVTFDLDGGVFEEGVTNKATYTFDSEVNLPTPTKEHFNFLGWYNGETKFESGAWKISKDVTLTAKWEDIKYTLTFDYNDGVSVNSNKEVKYNEFVRLPEAPKAAGLKFTAWNDGTKDITKNFFYKEEKNVTLTAKWSVLDAKFVHTTAKNKTYTITFKDNLATFETTDTTNFLASENTSLKTSVKNGNVIFNVNFEYDDFEIMDTVKGTSKVEVKFDAKAEKLILQSSISDVNGMGSENKLNSGAEFNLVKEEVSPIINEDVWKNEKGSYASTSGNELTFFEGKVELGGNLLDNSFYRNKEGYKIKDSVLTATYSDIEFNESILKVEISSDLSTITVLENFYDAGAMYGSPLIRKGEVFTKVSGPTRG